MSLIKIDGEDGGRWRICCLAGQVLVCLDHLVEEQPNRSKERVSRAIRKVQPVDTIDNKLMKNALLIDCVNVLLHNNLETIPSLSPHHYTKPCSWLGDPLNASGLTSLSLSAEDSRESHSSRRWTLPDGTSLRLNHCLQKKRGLHQNTHFSHLADFFEPRWAGRIEEKNQSRSRGSAWGLQCHMLTGLLKRQYNNWILMLAAVQ